MNFQTIFDKDRATRNKEEFEGTLVEYLEILKENPDFAKLSHKRMYDTIIEKGYEVIKPEDDARVRKIHGNQIIRRYNFLKNDFFGIDKTIMKIILKY